MDPDPKRQAAQRELDEAVQKFLLATGWEQGVLVSYALVGHQALPPDDEGNSRTGYPVVYMGGELPDHIALGLFAMGADFVRSDRHDRTEGL